VKIAENFRVGFLDAEDQGVFIKNIPEVRRYLNNADYKGLGEAALELWRSSGRPLQRDYWLRVSVSGETSDVASGRNASVSRGLSNVASGDHASVNGGTNNALATESSIRQHGYREAIHLLQARPPDIIKLNANDLERPTVR